MGQRLVIHLMNGKKEDIKKRQEICNAYFHWGAYTSDALNYLKKMIDNKDDFEQMALKMNEHAKRIKEDLIEDIEEEIKEYRKYINCIERDEVFKKDFIQELRDAVILEKEDIREKFEIYQRLRWIKKDDFLKNKWLKNLGILYLIDAGEVFGNEGIISKNRETMKGFNNWSEGDIWIDLEREEIEFDVFTQYNEDEIKDEDFDIKLFEKPIEIKMKFDEFENFYQLISNTEWNCFIKIDKDGKRKFYGTIE